MGNLFGGGGSPAPAPETGNNTIGGYAAAPDVSSGGFKNDGAKRMPSGNDKVQAENLRRLRQQLSSKSGRAANNLSGTRSYINNFLGGTL